MNRLQTILFAVVYTAAIIVGALDLLVWRP
jgi:hypothetical protein